MVNKYMGRVDANVRRVLGILALAGALVAWSMYASIGWAVVLGVVAAAMLITSTIHFCPTYLPFGFRTDRTENERERPPLLRV